MEFEQSGGYKPEKVVFDVFLEKTKSLFPTATVMEAHLERNQLVLNKNTIRTPRTSDRNDPTTKTSLLPGRGSTLGKDLKAFKTQHDTIPLYYFYNNPELKGIKYKGKAKSFITPDILNSNATLKIDSNDVSDTNKITIAIALPFVIDLPIYKANRKTGTESLIKDELVWGLSSPSPKQIITFMNK